jgi:hypothetical protein
LKISLAVQRASDKLSLNQSSIIMHNNRTNVELQDEITNLKSLTAELLQALRECWDDPDNMAGIIDKALEKAEMYEHEHGKL